MSSKPARSSKRLQIASDQHEREDSCQSPSKRPRKHTQSDPFRDNDDKSTAAAAVDTRVWTRMTHSLAPAGTTEPFPHHWTLDTTQPIRDMVYDSTNRRVWFRMGEDGFGSVWCLELHEDGTIVRSGPLNGIAVRIVITRESKSITDDCGFCLDTRRQLLVLADGKQIKVFDHLLIPLHHYCWQNIS